jgi:hypothetical protein
MNPMIESTANTTRQPDIPAAAEANNQAPATYHTPFGDVLVNQLTTPDIYALFGGSSGGSGSAAPAAASATPAAQTTGAQNAAAAESESDAGSDLVPTLASIFGANPWLANPGGTGPYGASWSYNPIYFATKDTAAKVAAMLGGTVVEESAILGPGPMVQNQPNEMVKLANGQLINPGLVASFYTHGYPQSYIDRLLDSEVQGA